MTKKEKREKAEIRSLERIGRTVLGENVIIRKIPAGFNTIGYTTIEKICYVYLSFTHKILDGLSEIEKVAFRKGVAAHEFLHRLLTDYKATDEILQKEKSYNARKLLMEYMNIVEDPAIEHFAHTQFSGLLLKALYFQIGHIAKVSPPITDSPTPLTQYLNALIQFGDIGIIKGEFTFPDAKKAFLDTVDMFYGAICEPVSKKRLQTAREMFDKTKYLWKEEVKRSDFADSIAKGMARKSEASSGDATSSGKIPPTDGTDARSEKVSGNQKKTLRKLGKISEESDETDSEDEEKTKVKSNETEESDESDAKSDGEESKDEGGNKSDSDSSDNTFNEEGEPASPESKGTSSPLDSEDSEYWSLDTDEMSEGLRKAIVKELSDETEKIDKEAIADTNDEPVESCDGIYGMGRALNVIYTPRQEDDAVYGEILADLEPAIRRVVHSLKTLLALDRQKVRPHNSGKIKAKNVFLSDDYITRKGRITENIFDKRILPKDKSNMAVAVCVDLSGSMGALLVGEKSRAVVARECSIALAEIFKEVNIPIYIMGFDADVNNFDTRHHHFVRWKNTPSERKTLARIKQHCNNRDGASIRYLTKILKNKDAKHKLLVVVSDGVPLASNYQGPSANADTTRAIEEAKRLFPVLGVSIGANEDVLKTFYGNDFIIAKNGNDLLYGIVGRLKKILK